MSIQQPGRPSCLKCEREGTPGLHKNSPVWQCPSCEAILLRELG